MQNVVPIERLRRELWSSAASCAACRCVTSRPPKRLLKDQPCAQARDHLDRILLLGDAVQDII